MGTRPKATAGYGAELWQVDVSPELKLAQVYNLKKSGEKQATDDTTNQDSVMDSAGRVRKEFIATIVDSGTVDCMVNLVETDGSHQALYALNKLNDGQFHDWELRWWDTKTDPTKTGTPGIIVAFTAILLDVPDLDFPVEKKKTATVKLSLIGDVTYTLQQTT